MSIKYTNLTYKELMELAPKDKPFQVVVPYNPNGEGKRQTLWAKLYYRGEKGLCLDTMFEFQKNIDNVDYYYCSDWDDDYFQGTFDLIVHHFDDTTLEQYQVGDEVEVLTQCLNLRDDYLPNVILNKILKNELFTITSVNKDLTYNISNKQGFNAPAHYRYLRKVVSKEARDLKKVEPKQTITIGEDTFEVTEELTNALKNLKKLNSHDQ